MNNPQLWAKANAVTSIQLSKNIFEKYVSRIKWKQNGGDTIMDIGCGTGDTTANILFPKFPKTISKVLGTDVNSNMIEFASKTYGNNPKIQFSVLDIGKEVPKNLHGNFDHVFSSFCFHWIRNQNLAFKNIYNLLRPNGDTLFWLVGDQPQVCLNYIDMSKEPEWSKYMTNLEDGLLPYRIEKYPEKVLKHNLEESGLKVDVSQNLAKEVEFPDEKSFKDFLESINPFVKNMPEEVRKKYMESYFERIIDQNIQNKSSKNIYFIDVLVAYAYKEP